MFIQENLKKKFLQKKNVEKKKIQQSSQINAKSILIQKTIKAFISRNKIKKQLTANNRLKTLLIFKNDLKQCQIKQVQHFSFLLKQQIMSSVLQNCKESFYLIQRLILASFKNQKLYDIGLSFLNIGIINNLRFIDNLLQKKQFFQCLKADISSKRGNGIKILNMLIERIYLANKLNFLTQEKIFQLILDEFKNQKMQIQESQNFKASDNLSQVTAIFLLKYLTKQNYKPNLKFQDFLILKKVLFIILSLEQKSQDKNGNSGKQISICYLIENILKIIILQHGVLVQKITKQLNHLYVLVQDSEGLQYFQNRICSHQLMESFSNQTLKFMKRLFQNKEIIGMFLNQSVQENRYVKNVMASVIKQLSRLFQDRKLIFVRSLLSSDQILKNMALNKNTDLFQGLKMRLLAMDDDQFIQFKLFNENQWKKIIQDGLILAFDIIKTKILKANKEEFKKLIPFSSKNDQQHTLKSISDALQNLYKKSNRTRKIAQRAFINLTLSNSFNTFNFGSGALAIAQMLKLFPFSFTFQSRLAKFKQFIKEDKKNYDRTLFLQDEIDEQLFIEVRRGHQFMDAFQACLNRDLRKKYKIVFFNEQGLQQQGIDGGGLIKQFINRVLKSGFSQLYALFQQTSQNQVIPNPYSAKTLEYQFIGKLVGKAVYQGITIQQKFAQPFLNLVIGRKNTFQDLQYIDPLIYKSMLSIKNANEEELKDMQQTFFILDNQPNGEKKYIDLLCPSKVPSFQNQVYVNSQNKMDFVMSYSHFKCNTQLEEKTRAFRKGFLKVMKPEWLTLFNNQELNLIISGGNPDFSVAQLRDACVYTEYHQKDLTIIFLWQTLEQFSAQDKSKFLLYVTSCSRPPTLGFSSMKPRMCISKDQNTAHLPTANTCMNVLRLPQYQNKKTLKQKLLYAINSKAGFEFA